MEFSTLNVLISAVAGLIAGAVGSLVAPWVHWGIEKRRIQLEERRKLLSSARNVVVGFNAGSAFLTSHEYARLRQHFSAEVVEKLEGRATRSGDSKQVALNQIARLEREWGIVYFGHLTHRCTPTKRPTALLASQVAPLYLRSTAPPRLAGEADNVRQITTM